MPDDFLLFSCEYKFEGRDWSVNFHARSFEEAEERIKAMQGGEIFKVNESWPAGDYTGTKN